MNERLGYYGYINVSGRKTRKVDTKHIWMELQMDDEQTGLDCQEALVYPWPDKSHPPQWAVFKSRERSRCCQWKARIMALRRFGPGSGPGPGLNRSFKFLIRTDEADDMLFAYFFWLELTWSQKHESIISFWHRKILLSEGKPNIVVGNWSRQSGSQETSQI